MGAAKRCCAGIIGSLERKPVDWSVYVERGVGRLKIHQDATVQVFVPAVSVPCPKPNSRNRVHARSANRKTTVLG